MSTPVSTSQLPGDLHAPAGLGQPEPAGPSDFSKIFDLVEEAREWLRKKGIDQWATPWPSNRARKDRIHKSLVAGNTWIVRDGLAVVATVTAQSAPCRKGLWTKEELRRPAVYLHRLVVKRSHAGKDIGAWLTDWAERRAADEYAAESTRIDVWTTNTALHQYYKGIGFRWLRNANGVPGNPSRALFERPIEQPGLP